MASVKVKLKSSGMKELLNSSGAMSACRSEAQPMLAAAQSGAPVATGAYRASLHLEEDHTDRARVRVVADVPYAMAVEADAGNLARALG